MRSGETGNCVGRRPPTCAARPTPAPARARAEVDKVFRSRLGPVLRELGFTASGRTWRREHPERTDIVALSSGGATVRVAYGTRFDAAHPPDEPYPVTGGLRDPHLDIRLFEEWPLTEDGLGDLASHLAAVVDPFLATLARYELARAFLEHDAGRPTAARRQSRPGAPAVNRLVGLLALAAGDRETAVDRLDSYVTWCQDRTDLDGTGVEPDDELGFWRAVAARARGLPHPAE